METMLKAVFVDFDGTFIDSIPALWKCYRLFLSRHGIEGEREEFTSLMGPPISEIVNLLKEKHQLKVSRDSLVHEYEAIVEASYATHTIPFPWAVETLQKQKAKGLFIAVVTSAYPSIVEKVLERHGIGNLFDAIFGSYQGEPHKPDPAIYRRALRGFELDPIHVVAIEDSDSGIRSATQAGIPTIAFKPEVQGQSNLGSYPLLHAANWNEVARLLDDINHRKGVPK